MNPFAARIDFPIGAGGARKTAVGRALRARPRACGSARNHVRPTLLVHAGVRGRASVAQLLFTRRQPALCAAAEPGANKGMVMGSPAAVMAINFGTPEGRLMMM